MVRAVARGALVSIVALAMWSCSPDDTPRDADTAPSAAAVTAADTAQAESLPLRDITLDTFAVRYRKGDVLRYRVTQSSEATQDSTIAQQRSSHVYTKTVREVHPDGTFTVAMRFDSIRVNFTARNRSTGAAMLNKSYSSSDSAQRASPEFIQYNALLGEDVDLVIDHRGGIVRVGNRRGLFTDLKLRGDQVSFGLRITIDPGVLVTHEFRGTVKGDAIEGTVRVTPDGGKAVDMPWRAARTSGTTYFQPTGLAVK